jgi:SAM-dependent methyltransferase
MSGGEYLLDNRAEDAGQRFGALASIFNPVTFRHIEALGIRPGWRCWEVGAGGPSVPSWMRGKVGPDGYVLATDLETGWIGEQGDGGFEVRRHDVASDDPPGREFDLVHARLVLVHVPGRDEALRRMVESLKPGGYLLLEDFDTVLVTRTALEELTPAHELANKIRRAFRELLKQRGVDLEYGRKLPRLLREAGLAEVRADAYFPVALEGGPPLEAANVNQVRDGLIGQGLATREEVEVHLEAIASGAVDVATPPLISAWGRKD